MPQFLFQPDPIDGVKFKPIRNRYSSRHIKIVNDEIFNDFQINTTESVIVGTDRDEVLEKSKEDLKVNIRYIES